MWAAIIELDDAVGRVRHVAPRHEGGGSICLLIK